MLYLAPIFVLCGINAVGGIKLHPCAPHEPFSHCHLVKVLHPVRRAAKCLLDSSHEELRGKDAEKSKEEHSRKLHPKEEYIPIENNRQGVPDYRTYVPALVRPYPEPASNQHIYCAEDNRYARDPDIEDCQMAPDTGRCFRPAYHQIPYNPSQCNPFFNPDYSCPPFNPRKTQNYFSWSPQTSFPNSFSSHPGCFPHSFFPPYYNSLYNPYCYHNPCIPQPYPSPIARYPFPPYSAEPFNGMLRTSQ